MRCSLQFANGQRVIVPVVRPLHLTQIKRAARTARTIIVGENPESRALQIVELPALEREPEHRADEEHQRDAQGNEQIEYLHGFQAGGIAPFAISIRAARCRSLPWSRSALSTTSSELPDMPIAAAHGVSIPEQASGSTSRL